MLALLAASIAITDKDLAPIFTEAASWTNILFFGLALFYLASLIFFAGSSVGKWGIALAFLICSFAITCPISYVEGWEREEGSPFVVQTKKWIEETQSAISNLEKETRLREKRAEEYDSCARQRDGMRIFAQLFQDSKITKSDSLVQAEVERFCEFESRRYNDQRQSELTALNVLRSLGQTRPTR